MCDIVWVSPQEHWSEFSECVILQVISRLTYSNKCQRCSVRETDSQYKLCLKEPRDNRLVVVLADSRPVGTPTPTHTPVTDTCQHKQQHTSYTWLDSSHVHMNVLGHTPTPFLSVESCHLRLFPGKSHSSQIFLDYTSPSYTAYSLHSIPCARHLHLIDFKEAKDVGWSSILAFQQKLIVVSAGDLVKKPDRMLWLPSKIHRITNYWPASNYTVSLQRDVCVCVCVCVWTICSGSSHELHPKR